MHNQKRYTSKAAGRGFTLIELMIAVAVVAILSDIAYPSYTQYTIRGKITEATSSLSDLRLRAEKWFADNRTYQPVVVSGTNPGFNQTITGNKYFDYACVAPTATTFTCTATGKPGDVGGFTYTINQANTKGSGFGGAAGWNNSSTCWVTKKGESC
jgi:type IV pilus assembly protein PilE